MPATLTYPGVYIEEIPSGVCTITGVSTSIAAFFGRATKGPINKAVRILNLSDYERVFGEPHPENDLALAVRLFFQNGGTDCYVVRLAKRGTTAKASINLKNETGQEVMKLQAKEPGKIGNELAVQVRYNIGDPEGAFDLTVARIVSGEVKELESHPNLSMDKSHPHYAPSFITQNSRLVDSELLLRDNTEDSDSGYSLSRRPIPAKNKDDLVSSLDALWNEASKAFKISVDGSPYFNVDLGANKLAEEKYTNIEDVKTYAQNKIKSAINDVLSPGLLVDVILDKGPDDTGDTVLLKITSGTVAKLSVRVQQAASNDLAGPLMLGQDQGGIEVPRYSKFRPAPNGTVFDLAGLNTLAELNQNSFSTLMIDKKTVSFETSLVTNDNADKWFKDGAGNSDGVREKLNIMAKVINDANIGWVAEVWGYRLALLPKSGINNLSSAVSTGPSNVGNLWLENVRFYSLGTSGTSGTSGKPTFQSKGVNGLDGDPPEVNDYKGSEADHTGFYALDLVDLFNLMVIPRDSEMNENDYRSLWAPASAYCKAHRAFLIIDAPENWSTSFSQVVTDINKLRAGIVKDHSAIFYPRLRIQENGLARTVGAGGAIAGLMARTDNTRGVWKAPAGTDADLRDILGLELVLTDSENGVLNKQGVNCLRVFPTGVVNWGARTLDGDDNFGSEWKYIPMRRLALFVEESLYRGAKWVVFEPNDEPLWAQIRLNIGAFMQNLFRQGAFKGRTPREAYFVKCDKETTTQNDINLGIVNILVGFAPLKPAEFVVIKLQQMAGQIDV